MKAFYFAEKSRMLCYGDGRKIAVGKTHSVKGKLKMCKNGLHASWRLMDALNYAPGPILYRVDQSGKVILGGDKICARKRTYLAEFDAEETLREFARRQALINIKKIKPYTPKHDYKLILGWLKRGDPDIRVTAWTAAWQVGVPKFAEAEDAAKSVAWSAMSPTHVAAWFAAEHAMHSAARTNADPSMGFDMDFSALHAAESAANKMLTKMVRKATGWDI